MKPITISIVLPSGKVVEQFPTGEPIEDTLRLARIVQSMYAGAILKISGRLNEFQKSSGG